MDMIKSFAQENGLDLAATESLFRYIMIRLQDERHLAAFKENSSAWLDLAVENWNKNSQEFADKYMNDEDYRNEVNNEVYDQLKREAK